TSVISFESVGARLLISFLIGPPVSAYLISKNRKCMIFISIIIDIIASTIGYYIAIYLDISIAGMIAVVIGTIFLCVFIYRKITNKYLM
ncbi:metal ABC transporter permease, partial [Streptobacillus moniliformis]|uniref:metal ABC transporter permease n=1 Tax=Streptobacillus moniliformis TaxID=34105 RepID=UPI000A8E7974